MEPEEGGGGDTEGHAPSSSHHDDEEHATPLSASAVIVEGEGPKSHDLWARVGELPSALGDKMLELRKEK